MRSAVGKAVLPAPARVARAVGPVAAGSHAEEPAEQAGEGAGPEEKWPGLSGVEGWLLRRAGTLIATLYGSLEWAVALTLFGFFIGLQRHEVQRHPVEALLLIAAFTLPLGRMRRAPEWVFAWLAAVAFVQWLVDVHSPADATLLLAMYAMASRRGGVRSLVAFGVLEGGIGLATVRWSLQDRGLATFVSLSAMATAAGVIGANARTRRGQVEYLQDRAVRLERERDQRAQLAVAGERARIAREMHDIVTHNLSVMVALADGAAFAVERSPERAAAAMRQASSTGRQAITDMRRFLGVLRDDEPDALRHPMPGIAQLGALVEQVRAAGLPTRLEVTGETATVPVAAQLTVYRLVQEALTNSLKHAPAGARADVRLVCGREELVVVVVDDGAGMPAAKAGREGAVGHGLAGMRERAAAYGGRLSAGPRPGGGWQVVAMLSLSAPEDV